MRNDNRRFVALSGIICHKSKSLHFCVDRKTIPKWRDERCMITGM